MGRARAEDDDLGALPSEFGKHNVVRCQVARDSLFAKFHAKLHTTGMLSLGRPIHAKTR